MEWDRVQGPVGNDDKASARQVLLDWRDELPPAQGQDIFSTRSEIRIRSTVCIEDHGGAIKMECHATHQPPGLPCSKGTVDHSEVTLTDQAEEELVAPQVHRQQGRIGIKCRLYLFQGDRTSMPAAACALLVLKSVERIPEPLVTNLQGRRMASCLRLGVSRVCSPTNAT